jgi:phosphoadenylyl-sulfate reductase (thioredoxin)
VESEVRPVDSAHAVIDAAVGEFGASLFILTSFQREGVIVIDLVLRFAPDAPVLTIDTGRLPTATHEMIRRIEDRYGLRVERIRPDPDEVNAMVAAHGLDLFRDSAAQRMLCCNIRKVRPLARRLPREGGYFSGLRRSQTAQREGIEVFDRSSTPVKINPLADWSMADVLRYTAEHSLPVHPLYEAGYTSIGCDPCTRAVQTGESERAGRWWWERDTAKECGMHFTPDGRAERTVDVLLRELLERTVRA